MLPVPRQSIEEIVRLHDRALDLYEIAFEKIAEADAAMSAAHNTLNAAAPMSGPVWEDRTEELNAFYKAIRLPDAEQFRRTARKIAACKVWDHLVTSTDLESLMDSQSKRELRDQMRYVPERPKHHRQIITEEEAGKALPPITVDNVYATIERFAADAEMIWRRGIANVFSHLDRRFKSHDGFKIGHRIILSYAFNESWSHRYREHRNSIMDVERIFCVLDGKSPKAPYGGIVGVVERERGGRYDAHQSEHEGDYFRIRVFKNGNAHLWFTRDDLLEKVNRILADWYGEVIGDGMTAEADPFDAVKTTPAKRFGFFPTPDAAADQLLNPSRYAIGPKLWRESGEGSAPVHVLEPSAGTGNLARLAAAFELPEWRRERGCTSDVRVDCIEIQRDLAANLLREGIYNRVIPADFLSITPEAMGRLYDLVLMNPPFDRERDIDHVIHALKFVKPGGALHAIMSAGTEFRETKKATAFREMVERMGGKFEDLPAGSFASVGTNVNTVIVRITKKGKTNA